MNSGSDFRIPKCERYLKNGSGGEGRETHTAGSAGGIDNDHQGMVRPVVPQERPLRFLALGDSYTIGEAVEYAGCWPVQLAELLRKDDLKVDEPVIVAKTGWTTDELMAGITEARPEGLFDLVSLLVGVNNQYRGRDAEEYRDEFDALLERAV